MLVRVLSAEPVLQLRVDENYYNEIFLGFNAGEQLDIPLSRENLDALYPDWKENVSDPSDVFNSLDLEYLVTIFKVVINGTHEYGVANFDWTPMTDEHGEPMVFAIDDDFGSSPCILTLYMSK